MKKRSFLTSLLMACSVWLIWLMEPSKAKPSVVTTDGEHIVTLRDMNGDGEADRADYQPKSIFLRDEEHTVQKVPTEAQKKYFKTDY